MKSDKNIQKQQTEAIQQFFEAFHLEDVLECLDDVFCLHLHRSDRTSASDDFDKFRLLKKLLVHLNPDVDRPGTQGYKVQSTL